MTGLICKYARMYGSPRQCVHPALLPLAKNVTIWSISWILPYNAHTHRAEKRSHIMTPA